MSDTPKTSSPAKPTQKLKVFVDADVLFAGSAAPSEHSGSHVILQMSEITLLDCVTSQQAITEVERNLAEKLPPKLPVCCPDLVTFNTRHFHPSSAAIRIQRSGDFILTVRERLSALAGEREVE